MIKKISKKLSYRNIIYFVVLEFLLQGCSPSETLVEFKKEKKATLGNVGLVSFYGLVGPVGLEILPTNETKEAIEDVKKILRAADPAPAVMGAFSDKIRPLLGTSPIRISENQLEKTDITSLGKIIENRHEKIDISSLGKRFNIDSLIILQTSDCTFVGNEPAYSTLPRALKLSLMTQARLIDIKTGEILWHKRVHTYWIEGVGSQYIGRLPAGKFRIKEEAIQEEMDPPFIVNVSAIKKATRRQVPFIVNELVKDWE